MYACLAIILNGFLMYFYFWFGKEPRYLEPDIMINYNLHVFAIWPVLVCAGAYYNINGI